jgi:DNA processing protein
MVTTMVNGSEKLHATNNVGLSWGAYMGSERVLKPTDFESRAVSPFLEMGAYEALWESKDATFRTIARQFAARTGAVPSDFVSEEKAYELATYVVRRFKESDVRHFGVLVHGAGEYPMRLRDATHPIELLYFQGWWDLAESRSVAVVGSRKPTREGIARTKRLVRELVKDDFTIVSGLAAGIDRVTHETTIEEGGHTIAVIGTPLSYSYPKENSDLQRQIAEHFLVVSQVPLKRYESQDYRFNRLFFPERNATMSALTEATIIVEASDTSGTLVQAREALRQHRKLFILDSCFRDSRLTWPARFEKKGAIRVKGYDDVLKHLSPKTE